MTTPNTTGHGAGTMSTAQAIDDRLAWLRERQTRISTLPRPVIEQISSLVIAPVRVETPVQVAPPAVLPVVGVVDGERPIKESSFNALQRMGLIGLKKSCDDIYLVIAAACAGGVPDLTRREIRELAESRYGRRIDDAWISARVFELVFADRVLERPAKRLCALSGTGNLVGAVYVVPKQTRMVW